MVKVRTVKNNNKMHVMPMRIVSQGTDSVMLFNKEYNTVPKLSPIL